MGLDISAYRQLKPEPDAAIEDGCVVDWQKYAQFHQSTIDYTEQHWPGHSEGVRPGVYAYSERHGFRAGFYSGYNQWRDHLSRVALNKSAEQAWEGRQEGPFSELIHFADNEGVIGSKIAAKLARDFAEHQDRAAEYAATISDGDWWLDKYGEWRKAFEMAADGGAVDFH